MIQIHNKKGVALIWSLITSAVLILVGSTMTNYVIKESKFSLRITDSSMAYTAAQSGVEWAKRYSANKCPQNGSVGWNGAPASFGPFNLTSQSGSATYLVRFITTPGPNNVSNACDNNFSGKVKVESTGIVGEVTRKVEYTFSGENLVGVKNTDLTRSLTATKQSFSLVYDFWTSGVTSRVDFGLKSASGEKIFVAYDGVTQTFKLGEGLNLSPGSISVSAEPNFSITNPSALKIRLDYLRGSAARLTVYKRDNNLTLLGCAGSIDMDLVGKDFSTLDSFYSSPAIVNEPGNTQFSISSSGEKAYFDFLAQKGLTFN